MNTSTNRPPVYPLLIDLVGWTLDRTVSLPKSQRFTFGERVDRLTLDCLELTLQAIYASPAEKTSPLRLMNLNLEKLRVFWRLICDRRWISQQQLFFVSRKLDEIGCMVGRLDQAVPISQAKRAVTFSQSCLPATTRRRVFSSRSRGVAGGVRLDLLALAWQDVPAGHLAVPFRVRLAKLTRTQNHTKTVIVVTIAGMIVVAIRRAQIVRIVVAPRPAPQHAGKFPPATPGPAPWAHPKSEHATEIHHQIFRRFAAKIKG